MSTDDDLPVSLAYDGQQVQESVFRLALECAGLALWDQDFRSGVVTRSPLWAKMLGYEPDEIDDHVTNWQSLIHPDDLQRTLETAFKHESSETAVFSVEHRMRTKDGQWRWIHNWGAVVERDEAGDPLRALGFHRDITDQKMHEQALRESEQKYRSVIEQSGENIFLMDVATSRIVESNQSLRKMLGYSREEMAELYLHDFVSHTQADINARVAEAAEAGRLILREHTYRRKDGSALPVEVNITCIELAGRKVLCIVSRDISERKQYEAEMKAVHDELEHRVREQTAQLREANQQLEDDRAALRQKNVALRELLQELESSRTSLARQIQTNVDRVSRPLLSQLESDNNPRVRLCARILRQSLEDVLAPVGQGAETHFDSLSRREVQVCEMVRNGMSTKDIALVLGTSPETVRKQRAMIRRKLGLTNSTTNLGTYLRRLESNDH